MTRFTTAAIASLAFVSTGASAAEFVTNGGFELGNTGFGTGYTYVAAPGPSALVPEGTYTVGSNAAAYHSLWANVGARTGANFLIANGSPGNNISVWSQTLTGLLVGSSYTFNAYATNVCCNSDFGGPNGVPVIVAVDGAGFTVTQNVAGPAGSYTNLTGSFVAASSSVTLSIYNDNSVASGNDFGLDDISVTGAAVPEPATWLMMALGFGLVGSAARLRKARPVAA